MGSRRQSLDTEAWLKSVEEAEEATTRLVVSQSLSSVFATAWQFALPLALLDSGGPSAAATLMAAVTGAKVALAPSVGRAADGMCRLDAARCARVLQASGVAAALAALPRAAEEPVFLGGVLCGAALEALGYVVSKNAPRKDWAPALLRGSELRRCNLGLANAALGGELAGPALGAALLSCHGSDVTSGALVVGALTLAAEVPAQAALESLGGRASVVAPRSRDAPTSRGPRRTDAWATFLSRPSAAAATAAFALLWLTALSPHTPLLLASLADRGAPPGAIAAFRAAGALAGAGGVAAYGALGASSEADAKAVAAACLGGLAASVSAAAALWSGGARLELVMAAVVLSRVCLYAFDVAYLELQQQLVPDGDRNAVQGCEAALTATAELGVACLALAYATHFDVLADASALAVLAAFALFSTTVLEGATAPAGEAPASPPVAEAA